MKYEPHKRKGRNHPVCEGVTFHENLNIICREQIKSDSKI
jgi:hypothetical protein